MKNGFLSLITVCNFSHQIVTAPKEARKCKLNFHLLYPLLRAWREEINKENMRRQASVTLCSQRAEEIKGFILNELLYTYIYKMHMMCLCVPVYLCMYDVCVCVYVYKCMHVVYTHARCGWVSAGMHGIYKCGQREPMSGPHVFLAFSCESSSLQCSPSQHQARSPMSFCDSLTFSPISQEHWDYCTQCYVHSTEDLMCAQSSPHQTIYPAWA